MLAVINGKIITVTKGIIEKGTVLIKDGKITAVGTDITIPEGYTVIDVEGKWVTPGLIDAHTHLSTFSEPQTMPGMHDGNECSDPVTAHVRALDALNPHDIGIQNARKGGFTTCFTGPGSGNVIGGTGLSIKLKDGDTVFDIAIPGTEHMKMALGENPRRVYGSQKKMPMTRMGVGAVLRETLYNAKIYSDQLKEAEKDPSKAPKANFKLDPLVPVVRGEMKARIHAHRADDIVTAVRIAQEFNLDYCIEHCTESYKIIDFMKENKVDCILGPLANSPYSKMEVWGRKLETPGILEKAGIEFSVMEDTASATQYLPIHIGMCIARGLSEKTAFESVTIRPAKLLGLANRVGSIEVGKDGDLAIFSGNPFSSLNRCEKTIIEGVVYDHLAEN